MPARRRGREVLRAAVGVVVGLAVVYAVLCALFAMYEPVFVFRQLHRERISPPAAGLSGFADIEITADDGIKLYGWWRVPDPGRGVVVYLTGSGVTMSDFAPRFRELARRGLGVAAMDYRGNGASPGVPSEAGWRADARALFDFAHKMAPQAKIAVFGESMGTGFAVELARDRPVAGILLNSPYASMARLFAHSGMPLLHGVPIPARWLMRDTVDAEAQIAGVQAPVMILAGAADRVIPVAEARRLYDAANEPKTMIVVPGAGHTGAWQGETKERALDALVAWTAPDPAPAKQ